MTIQYIKEFGQYRGFDELSKSWLYTVETKVYKVNKNGAFRIN